MNLLDSILNAGGGRSVSELAGQFGLRDDQAKSAVETLLPALAGGLQRNVSQGGLNSLLEALSKGQHQRYLDNPSTLQADAVRQDGDGILGHVLGNKDVSRRVAAQASQRTGISESVLKQMLPVVAALAMGALSKGVSQSGNSPAAGGNILSMLTPLLDRDGDGSVVNDILGSVSGFFKK